MANLTKHDTLLPPKHTNLTKYACTDTKTLTQTSMIFTGEPRHESNEVRYLLKPKELI